MLIHLQIEMRVDESDEKVSIKTSVPHKYLWKDGIEYLQVFVCFGTGVGCHLTPEPISG